MQRMIRKNIWKPVDWLLWNRPRVFGWAMIIGLSVLPVGILVMLAEFLCTGSALLGLTITTLAALTFFFGFLAFFRD